MQSWPDPPPSGKEYAQEGGLGEERKHALHRQRLSDDAAGVV